MSRMMFLIFFGLLPMIYLIYQLIPKWKLEVATIGSLILWYVVNPLYMVIMLSLLIGTVQFTHFIQKYWVDRKKRNLFTFLELSFVIVLWDILWSAGVLQSSILFSFAFLISSLEAIFYSKSVYDGKIRREKGFGRIGLYLVGFPKLFLSRYFTYDQFYHPYRKENLWKQSKQAFLEIFYGLIQAMVIGKIGIEITQYMIVNINEQSIFLLLFFLPLFFFSCYHIWMGLRKLSDGLWRLLGFDLKQEGKVPFKETRFIPMFIAFFPSLFGILPFPHPKKEWSRKYALSLMGIMVALAFLLYPTFESIYLGLLFGILVSCDATTWVQKRPVYQRRIGYGFLFSLGAILFLCPDGLTWILGIFGKSDIPFWGPMTLYQLGQYIPFYALSILTLVPWKKRPRNNKSLFIIQRGFLLVGSIILGIVMFGQWIGR